ncbi:MAG: acyltransferase [Spirochaetaceae bacterium]|nr:MAG: acyltransferase [Spirochaetaceae bacterium]
MNGLSAARRPTPPGPIDVGAILADRNPSLHKRLKPLGVWLLRAAIHERKLNAAMASFAGTGPGEFAETALGHLGVSVRTEGLEYLRAAHRPVVCANHPTGAVEGLALIAALWRSRGACRVPANDLLCLIAPLEPIIVPVRHGALSRASADEFVRAFAEDDPLLTFPAGVTAREHGGRLREYPWRASFVTRARATGRDLLPAAVSGRNSRRFYTIHRLRRLFGVSLNIEMTLLVDEMLRRRGDTVVVRFLPPHRLRDDRQGLRAGDDRQGGRTGDERLARAIQREVEQTAANLDIRRRQR